MIKRSVPVGIEINTKLVGALFTDKIGDTLRIFCYYTNGDTSQFDVPIEDNTENLRGLLSTLSMEETCTSLILDEVVLGRVYVQVNNEYWLYTLLRSPREIPPPCNADLADLAWKICWRSHEAEVLRYEQPDGPERCMAIRTPMSESDASRLTKTAKAFLKPISPPRKQSKRWEYLYIIAALLAVTILIAGTWFYTFKAHQAPVVAARPKPVPIAGSGYYLLYNHRISGPFDSKAITDMNNAGLFPAETMCRRENSTDWIKISTVFPPTPQQP